MTRHSTLTNPNDLHYAKIRTFTGNPAAIAPDFIDQILSATDTNKVYRATGTTFGAMVELVASGSTGGGGGSGSAINIVDAYPLDYYGDTGNLLFDLSSQRLFVAARSGSKAWIPTSGKAIDISVSVTNESSVSSDDLSFYIFYTENAPSPPFDFFDNLGGTTGLAVGDNDHENIGWRILANGPGFYTLGYSYVGSADPPPNLNTNFSASYSGFDYALSVENYGLGLTVNGLPISENVLRFERFPLQFATLLISASIIDG